MFSLYLAQYFLILHFNTFPVGEMFILKNLLILSFVYFNTFPSKGSITGCFCTHLMNSYFNTFPVGEMFWNSLFDEFRIGFQYIPRRGNVRCIATSREAFLFQYTPKWGGNICITRKRKNCSNGNFNTFPRRGNVFSDPLLLKYKKFQYIPP